MKSLTIILVLPWLLVAQQKPRFSSTVQLVMVDVQAVEKGTGRVIDLLGPNDFEVYADDRRREIKEFHFETTPLDIVFLIYGRSGVGPAKEINAYHKGLAAAVGALKFGDRVAIIRTDSASKVDLAMTDDFDKARRVILNGSDQHYRTGYGHLYDAALAATALFARPKEANRRRAILAISGDVEHGSKIKLDALITELLESDATFNEAVVVLGTTARRVGVGGVWGIPRIEREIGGARSGESLIPAVEATGGEEVPGDKFEEVFPELVERIRARYLLGFYAEPTPQREYHSLEVRLSTDALKRYPNALIRARRGFYTDATSEDARK